jgi:hypothetical protein
VGLSALLARRASVCRPGAPPVLAPLGMTSTMVTLTDAARARFAQGSTDGGPAAGWNLDALAGAGALRSSAEDMTTFLAAAMGLRRTPLDSAFRLAAAPQFDAGPSGVMRIGLGWHVRQVAGGIPDRVAQRRHRRLSQLGGVRPGAPPGVVVLTNSPENIDDIGLHLLDSPRARPVRIAVALRPPPSTKCVGAIRWRRPSSWRVRREGDHLMVQATGQPAVRIWASSPDEFFLKVVDAQISFTRGADGKVDALVLHQGGRDQRAPRAP